LTQRVCVWGLDLSGNKQLIAKEVSMATNTNEPKALAEGEAPASSAGPLVAREDGATTPADDGASGDADAIVNERERPGRPARIRKWFRDSPFRRMMGWIVGLLALTGVAMRVLDWLAPLSWLDVYATMLSWQTGIGAFFGLGALMLAALYNAELNRRRDDRLTDEKRRNLANALAAEFEALTTTGETGRDFLFGLLKKYGKISTDILTSTLQVQTPILDRSLGDLGLLPRDVVANIIHVRQRLRNKMTALQARIGGPDREALSGEIHRAIDNFAMMEEHWKAPCRALHRFLNIGEFVPEAELKIWIDQADKRLDRNKSTIDGKVNAARAEYTPADEDADGRAIYPNTEPDEDPD
jgi:hypothetical protein